MKGSDYIPLIIERLRPTDPEQIILFGSYAYGKPTEESDLDILVVTGDNTVPSTFSEKSLIYLKVAKAIADIRREFPVDLLVHTKAMHKNFVEKNSLFARELLTNGKVIYEKTN